MMNCREFSRHIGDYVNHTMDAETATLAREHLRECPSCASAASELSKTSALVESLPRLSTPLGFEERLRARMGQQAAVACRRDTLMDRVREFRFTFGRSCRLAFTPALAGLILCLMVATSVFVVGRRHYGVEPKPDFDSAYISTCQAQHVSFTASSPLADESAAILQERTLEANADL